MKYILLISTLMFSAGSWAEWTLLGENVSGSAYYVDFDRIRKVKGLVYYWTITDLLEPNEYGTLSSKTYYKADCETMRSMMLSHSAYKLPMAEGTARYTSNPDPKWDYAPPGSVMEDELEAVCNH